MRKMNRKLTRKLTLTLLLLAVLVAALLGVSLVSHAAGKTQLRITVWAQGHGKAQRYRLSCGPARGNLPKPGQACALLNRTGTTRFNATPPNTMCTQIYGGPATAQVVGAVRGRQVSTSFSLTNGCEVSRWDKARLIVPQPKSSALTTSP
jgi:hypothetical protein